MEHDLADLVVEHLADDRDRLVEREGVGGRHAGETGDAQRLAGVGVDLGVRRLELGESRHGGSRCSGVGGGVAQDQGLGVPTRRDESKVPNAPPELGEVCAVGRGLADVRFVGHGYGGERVGILAFERDPAVGLGIVNGHPEADRVRLRVVVRVDHGPERALIVGLPALVRDAPRLMVLGGDDLDPDEPPGGVDARLARDLRRTHRVAVEQVIRARDPGPDHGVGRARTRPREADRLVQGEIGGGERHRARVTPRPKKT